MSTASITFAALVLFMIPTVHASNLTTCYLADVQRNGSLIADCDVLCKNAAWSDPAVFYIGNYLTHALTVRSNPGQPWERTMVISLTSLFFPSAGLLPAVKAIASGAFLAKSPLRQAAKAGALYMVVKAPEGIPLTGAKTETAAGQILKNVFRFPAGVKDATVKEPRNVGSIRKHVGAAAQIDESNGHPAKRSDVDKSQSFSMGNALAPPTDAARDPGLLADRESKANQHDDNDRSPSANLKGITSDSETPAATRVGERIIFGADGAVLSSPEHDEAKIEKQTHAIAERNLKRREIGRAVHGQVKLPEGYILRKVPDFATFENEDPSSWTVRSTLASFHSRPKSDTHDSDLGFNIPQNYNFLQAAVALGQALYAFATLYQTRGVQIERFGYAAYGLTVLPYAFMSVVNLLSNVLCPNYPAIFIVDNAEARTLRCQLDEQGKSSDFVVSGQVGRLSADTEARIKDEMAAEEKERIDSQLKNVDEEAFRGLIRDLRPLTVVAQVVTVVAGLAFYLGIVGGLTRFSKGDSTISERAWIMSWYCVGAVIGPLVKESVVDRILEAGRLGEFPWTVAVGVAMFAVLFYGTPAIGGFVMVGRKIRKYGICEQI